MLDRSRWLLLGALLEASLPRAASAQNSPREVCVTRTGWDAASATPEEVRDALALRLPDRTVSVCARADPEACLVSPEAGTPWLIVLRVECPGREVQRDEVALGPRDEVVRRVAVVAAALLGGAPGQGDLGRRPPPPATVSVLAPQARPGAKAPASTAMPPPALAVQLRAGGTLAPELPDATFALVIDLRWFVWGGVHATGGAKLAGRFEQRHGEEIDSVADRAFWVGAGYRAALSDLFLDVALAGQYTIPVMESTGASGQPEEESSASRLAVRGAAMIGWRFHPSLAAVLDVAMSMSVVERDVNVAGRDALDIGTAIVDVSAGLEVEF